MIMGDGWGSLNNGGYRGFFGQRAIFKSYKGLLMTKAPGQYPGASFCSLGSAGSYSRLRD